MSALVPEFHNRGLFESSTMHVAIGQKHINTAVIIQHIVVPYNIPAHSFDMFIHLSDFAFVGCFILLSISFARRKPRKGFSAVSKQRLPPVVEMNVSHAMDPQCSA